MFELKELHNFVAVAERQNISSAAKAVPLSQPALSRQIQALERKLDVMLFERIGKRLALTAEGSDLLKQASLLLDQAQAPANRAYGLEQGHFGLLRVGATPQINTWLLSPVMSEFNNLYPHVELNFSEGHNDALIELVENGGVHLSIVSPATGNNLIGKQLFMDQLLVILPPAHPLANKSSININQIAKDRFLLLRRGFLTRQMFDHACAESGMRPQLLIEGGSVDTLVALAHDGHGIAVISSSTKNARQIGAIPLVASQGPIELPVSVVWNPNRRRPACLPAFVDLLIKHASEE